jgi:hypothetical protein
MSVAPRMVTGLCVLLFGVRGAAAIEVEDPSDYVRILESDQRDLWGEAVVGLLAEDDDLPLLSVSSVVRRLSALDPELQVRVVRAMGEHPEHPKVVPTLWSLMRGTLEPDGEEENSDPIASMEHVVEPSPREAILRLVQKSPPMPTDPVRQAARSTLLVLLDEGQLSEVWMRRLQDVDEEFRSEAEEALSRLAQSQEEVPVAGLDSPPEESHLTPPILIASAVLSGLVGVFLFIWAFRLWQLSVRIRNRPISKVSSLAMGPVALEGEVQPTREYLAHPVTGELCVYYARADADYPNAHFWLEDGSGRVLVNPRRAVLFSDDDVLVAGERVHIVGSADRDAEGNITIRKDETAPPLYRRIVHRVIEILFGFGHDSSITRMLFADPHRCFWIWDDLERRPMGEGKDVAWLAAAFVLGGAWMLVFGLAVLGLIDAGTVSALLQGI